MLAADVSYWLRPGGDQPGAFVLPCLRAREGPGADDPGLAVLGDRGAGAGPGVLDAVRPGPDDDETAVTAAQARAVVTRLIKAGHWRAGDPPILIISGAGYDVTRLSFLLADLPVDLLGRLRSDRVMQLPAPPRQPGTIGRPRKHGGELALADPATWPAPQITTTTMTSRYGTAVTAAWDRVHPRLTHRAGQVS
jgi:DDE superfamily endonuclease